MACSSVLRAISVAICFFLVMSANFACCSCLFNGICESPAAAAGRFGGPQVGVLLHAAGQDFDLESQELLLTSPTVLVPAV